MRMREATMKMAEEKKKKNVILKGTRHTVTVEESGPDIVVVRLEYSGFIYRGALLNLTNREVPCGVNSLRLQSNVWTATASSVNDETKEKSVENSAVINRFSYKTEPLEPLPDKAICARPTKSTNRAYKEKTVRNIRLRPRQILCAKCKSSCSDNQETKKTSANDSVAKSSIKEPLPPPSIPLKISLKKPNPISPKVTRQTKSAVIQKTSPIIKISFNNPQGEGTVVNIPRKVQNSENEESDTEIIDKSKQPDIAETVQSESASSKRVKKSIRKAKERLQPYPTHSKHGKHKKHKHKHDKRLSHEMNPVVALSPLNLENISQDNCETKSFDKDSTDHPYRSPLRAKVIMKRERSASGSLRYVYEAHRISNSPKGSEDSCPKSLTVNLCNIEQGEKSDHDSDCNVVDDEENIGPLMMRIQNKPVNKVILDDQRTIGTGDIVWGKIHGFPWWPGRVESIKIGQKCDGSIIYQQAHVSWFGSSTRSDIACNELYNFLDDFDQKFNKKKRGPYRVAIKEATRQAKGLVSIAEETESHKSESTAEPALEEVVMSETDCDIDVEVVGKPTSPTTLPVASPVTLTDPCSLIETPEIQLACSPIPSDPLINPPVDEPLSFSPKYSPVSLTSPMKYSPVSMTSPPSQNSPLSTPKYSTSPRYSPVPRTSLKYAPAPMTTPSPPSSPKYPIPMTTLMYAPAPMATTPPPPSTPEYPAPMTSLNYAPASLTTPPPPSSSPNYSSIPMTSLKYAPAPLTTVPSTSPKYPSMPLTSLKYAPAPMASSYYSPAPKYSPVPMTSLQYSPAPPVSSPYFNTTTSSVTSPYYSSLSVTSPFYNTTTTSAVASPYYSTVTTSAAVTSPYYAAASQITSPYYSNVISPYYSPAPVTSQSPMPQSPATPSSPKPLARYSPKYSPVTPTPSPLHSPVMASPVQCV